MNEVFIILFVASQIEKSELATPTGQPNVLRHKLYTLRPELVDSFLR